MGRPSSLAVSIHSSITTSTFLSAASRVGPSEAQPGNSGTSAIKALSSSLASRVLIVYDPNDVNSTNVANHYRTSRGVPMANMCSVTPNEGSEDLTPAQYATVIKAPVQACLTAVGPSNILYIVIAYVRPYKVNDQGPIYLAMDSVLSDVWDQYTTQYFRVVPSATHRYYYETQSQGNVYAPFQSLAAFFRWKSRPSYVAELGRRRIGSIIHKNLCFQNLSAS